MAIESRGPLCYDRAMSLIHAFDHLAQATSESVAAAAVFGSDATLRFWTIESLTADGDVTQFDGDTTRWSDLRDELATASLFDQDGKRSIVVRQADKFVTDYRSEIEAYLNHPGDTARFVLELTSLATNTRVYKKLQSDHLLVACGTTPDKKLGVTAASRRKFLTGYVARRHGAKLAPAAADTLIEMIGEDIGMLATEIAKLALYCRPDQPIDEPLVRDIVAGWQGKTVWQITDAIAAGDAAEALRQLDKLMSGGQRPIALLPQIAWSLRRLGMATAIVEHREREGRSWQLEEALSLAGINRPAEIGRATSQLKGLGRNRARQLLPWLLDADLRLKGTHSAEGRDRFLLEQLVLRLAKRPS
jgi:DNA polymerase-3 subunit delta